MPNLISLVCMLGARYPMPNANRWWKIAENSIALGINHLTFWKERKHVFYIHHNPVKHGYVKKWQDWPFGSAVDFLNTFGREYTEHLWRKYPIKRYGASWDP